MSESIQTRLQNEMMATLKARDANRRGILSFLVAAVKKMALETKPAHMQGIPELTDANTISVLKKERAQRQETLLAAEKGNRTDLVEKTRYEISVIDEYLPQAASPEETERVAKEVIAELSATSLRDMGKVMAEVPNRLPSVDKSSLSSVVKKLLTPA